MADWLPVVALLWALRSFERIHWRPAGGILFEGRRTGAFQFRPQDPMSADSAGLVFLSPFRFVGSVFRSGSEVSGKLDLEGVRKLIVQLHGVSGRLLRAEVALSVHLFLVVPLVWGTLGLFVSWPYLVTGTLLVHALVIASLQGALRQLGVTGTADRWQRLLPYLLSPPAATEAMLGLTKDLLREYHPLAVAAVLCDDERFRLIANPYWRRTVYPLNRVGDGSADDATADGLAPKIREILVARLGPDAVLLEAPRRRTAGASWYCPRCLSEYSRFNELCADCPGVKLEAFEENDVR